MHGRKYAMIACGGCADSIQKVGREGCGGAGNRERRRRHSSRTPRRPSAVGHGERRVPRKSHSFFLS